MQCMRESPSADQDSQAGSIITLRLIQFTCVVIISRIGTYYVARPCEQVAGTIGDTNRTIELYPDCAAYFSGANPDQHTVVHADLLNATSAAEAGAAVSMPFGMALWLALAIHAIGIELYVGVWHCPSELERERISNMFILVETHSGRD